MSVGAADILKAINSAWDASGLDAIFKALWPAADNQNNPVLHDTEASPKQPFPYCVMETGRPSTKGRMSYDSATKRELREVVVAFNIHAMVVTGDTRSSKEIAAYLASEVMKVFGGHPSVAATQEIGLDNGGCLLVQCLMDYPICTALERYQWIISYLFRLDVPVAV
jgi:hypothetical protein